MSEKDPSNEPKASGPEKGPQKPPKVEAKAKKTWSNPALRMMGVPKVSLPSRNWMIFWSVLGGIGGAIWYDKHEQTEIRQKYMKQVEHLSKEVYDNNRLPRKLTIFVAPPPDDFLDVSMKYFKKYVKPILNAAAIDFDVLVANKQGDIRSSVSERIRQLRRTKLEQEQNLKLQQAQQEYNKSWKKFITVTVPDIIKSPFTKKDLVEDELKNYNDMYAVKDVVGYYYKYDPITPVRDDSLDPEKAGGVVCVGRGAYKEYLQGVHEGLLGPLDPPKTEANKVSELDTNQVSDTNQTSDTNQGSEANQTGEASTNADSTTEEPEEKAPRPYILPQEYPNAQLAPEFNFNEIIRDEKQVPVLFEQPIYVFPVPNVLGFKNTPRKIYNFFTKRYLAQDFSERTMHLIKNQARTFEYKDQLLAKEEELLWPKRWVEKGKDKGSEWVQDLVVDERVTSKLRVYD